MDFNFFIFTNTSTITTRMFMAMLANMEMKITCNADDGVADDTDGDDPRDDSCDSGAVAAGDHNV